MDGRFVCQQIGDLERIRHHGERDVGQGLGEVLHGGAGIEENGLPLADLGHGGTGDLDFCPRILRGAFAHGELPPLGFQPHGSAMGPHEHALGLELLKVAAHSLLGHAESLGHFRGADAPVLLQQVEHLAMSFEGEHVGISLNDFSCPINKRNSEANTAKPTFLHFMSYKYVNYLWDDAKAASLDFVSLLVYRSNLLGSDQRITNTGGGNTSSKIVERDPLSGEEVEVLWVKGSGGDLRTSKKENFSSLYQSKLIDLQKVYASREERGLKSQAEDDMVGMYPHTTFNLNPRPSSIDTPLHSFLPGKHVDHMHPNAIISIAASRRCEELTKEIFGGEMAYVGWMRPGFELGLAMQEISRQQPGIKAIMMGQHGFISWDDDAKVCYTRTLDFIEKPPRTLSRSTRRRAAMPEPSAARAINRSTKRDATRCLPRSSRGCAVR